MDVRFQLLTILKTINTKPRKGRAGDVLSKAKAGLLYASAVLFVMICVYSFWRTQDTDGFLFLALAFYCAVGGFFHKRLFRRDSVATIYCIALALGVVYATLWCYGGTTVVMWALFFPCIAISLCQVKMGGLISGSLAIHFLILFYTPVLRVVPAEYPAEVGCFYPVLYGLGYAVTCVYSYHQHKQLVEKQYHEEMLEKAMKTERSNLMAMTTQTILSISNAVDARDSYTQRHSARVAEYSVMLAKTLNWEPKRVDQLYSIALLHDIGKIGISDSILNKHAALTPEEREVIKQHTVIGGEILKDLTLLPNASIGAVSHHERYDGTGYPYGLKGKQIPLEARIIGIADAFDAMNSSRVYRARITPKKIMQELRDGRGCQFDPELLDRFLPIAEKLLQEDVI